MDDGLIQFLFIAIFVIVSMMDGAARKRRKEAQRLGHIPEASGVQEADDDLGEVAQSSEGMVPEDLWKEIAALARGETTAPARGRPATPDPGPIRDRSPEEDGWTATRQELPLNRVPGMDTGERVRRSVERPVRLDAPAPTGTPLGDLQGGYVQPDPAATHMDMEYAEVASTPQRLPAERPHEPVLHASEPSTDPTKAPRRARVSRSLLAGVRHGAKQSLRDAIVVAEVLSPPIALRDTEGGHLS